MTENKQRGKLVVLYGINNVGKSMQVAGLVKILEKEGRRVASLKYPLYDVPESGQMLNEALRKANPEQLTPRELQMLYCQNRTQYDSVLRNRLAAGETLIVEDYTGTSLAWGMVTGVDKHFLIRLNAHLAPEDCAILLEGVPFGTEREKAHMFESDDNKMRRARKAFSNLASELGWHVVSANRPEDEVRHDILLKVRAVLGS